MPTAKLKTGKISMAKLLETVRRWDSDGRLGDIVLDIPDGTYIEWQDAQAAEPSTVYKNTDTGERRVVADGYQDDFSSAVWMKVADRPHEDGDYSYTCLNEHCRCWS
jgi:hypothetical protein